jgi:hypothetical protein
MTGHEWTIKIGLPVSAQGMTEHRTIYITMERPLGSKQAVGPNLKEH